MFELNSDITIGNFRFSGVNEVKIKQSLHGIVDTAVISIPSIAKIVSGDRVNSEKVITGKQFKDGDPVTINLGYNSDLQTEFRGFVKYRDLNMPLEVECEGYSWLLRRNTINGFWISASIKELLAAAVSGIDPKYNIAVKCMVDFEFTNVHLKDATGFDIINYIGKCTDGCVTCFFIEPDTLWCGLVYTPFASGEDVFNKGLVNLKPGYNVIKDNSLKARNLQDDPVQVKYSKKRSNGEKVSQTSDIFKNYKRIHSKILNQVNDLSALKDLSNEKTCQLNFSGYEGSINAFLQPYAAPGYMAYVTDGRYPELDGTYLIESTEVSFGVKGARRKIEIGPRKGFKNDTANE